MFYFLVAMESVTVTDMTNPCHVTLTPGPSLHF